MSQWHEYIKNDPRWKACRVEVLDRDDRMCVNCNATTDLQVDHVTPLAVLFALGVTEEAISLAVDPDHCVTLCGLCNRRKGKKITEAEPTTYVNAKWAGLGL